MSAVSLSTIRKRFASAVTTLSGFDESRNPFDGYGRSPNTIAHKRFSVGVGTVTSREDDRQRRSDGIMTDTQMSVRFAFRIRPKDQIESYDNALDAAEQVIEIITNRSTPLHDSLQIRFTGLDNELADSGEWCTLTLSFSVLHYIQLT
tara:strand:+ start:9716 stop:10159 length:444 start_codon:yes stop_codon:yes gene_type:complete